jgi:ABC-2 type transport system ATP-binding protein
MSQPIEFPGPMIETHELRKSFRSGKTTVEAVRGVDLRVERGQIFGFLGPNGAGKTTMLRMLATLLPPTSGEARVAGVDLVREPQRVRERIGYVAQGGGTDPTVTGRDEVIIQGRLYGMNKRDAQTRAIEVLQSLGLDSAADRKTGTYSGGMRRRLDLGLGLVHRPSLLFLDEPTTGLDPQARANLWDEIRKLSAGGMTVFMTTHYLEEADVLCDRLAIIDHGLIVAEGTPEELKHDVAGEVVTLGVGSARSAAVQALAEAQTYVREVVVDDGFVRLYVDRGETALPALLRLLDGAGLAPTTVALAQASLDDVFLRKTGRTLRDEAAA